DPALEKHPDDRAALLATVDARLLAAAAADDPDAQRLRESCLKVISSVKSGSDDPRLLALKVSALLALGREDEAQSAIAKLRESGYRDPALVDELRRSGIDYPRDALAEQRLRAVVSDNERQAVSRN
ncbi:MAG TPA: hypothetical protein VLB69_03720, partial [Rudaea sp.]|nr:hypothetical protein [Rudaea sp.]